jgi:hypothetical protein
MTGRFEHFDARSGGSYRLVLGSTLQITRRDCRPRWTISPLPLNAERRLPRSRIKTGEGMTEAVSDRMAELAGHETRFVLNSFDHAAAWRLGTLMAERALRENAPRASNACGSAAARGRNR